MRRRDDKFPDNGFEAWGGYMNAKIQKLEEQFARNAGQDEDQLSNIFNGVSIYVNGYTIPSADDLKTLMSKHGGVYHTYQRSEDFIIASNLPDTKVKKMSLSRVVQPQWITDSIASNKLLDYHNYLLYKNSRMQPTLNFTIKTTEESKQIHSVEKIEEHKIVDKGDLELFTYDDSKPLVPENNIEQKSEYCHDDQNSKTDSIKTAVSVTKTAADPSFISEFYNNSRLHHISQLGACFKQHVNDLRENSNFQFPSRAILKETILGAGNCNSLSPITFEKEKTIMHIDMDCFFVSVGLRKRPELLGKPVAVTHSKGGQPRTKRPGVDRNTEFNLYKQKQCQKISKATGRPDEEIEFESRVDNITDEDDKLGSMSEIASCSYEARSKGISNGMFMGTALKLCPELQTIPYDFEGYKEVAYTLYNTIAQYTLDIEAVSCDEMYVDCTELLNDLNVSVQEFATALRKEIKLKTGCPSSTGFGGNRLQARLATKRAKPDGQFFLTADLVEDFMFDIKLKDLPGVGRHTAQKLEALGYQTCGSLQALTLAALKAHLGIKFGAHLFDQCRGRDPNPLSYHTVRKSVSAEVNYGIRFETEDQCADFLKQLSAEVHSRMKQFKVVGKCITLKLMVRAENAPVETAKFMGHGFCDVINKSVSLNNATNDLDIITREVKALCKKINVDPKEMRGVGIQITKLKTSNITQRKGAINKFLTTKPFKVDNVNNNNKILIDQVAEKKEPITSRTPTKLKPQSPKNKSPIIQIKSPQKRRGRPPKLKLQAPNSANLLSRYLQGPSTVKDTPYKNPMIKEVKEIKYESVQSKKSEVKLQPAQSKTFEAKPQGLIGLPWNKVRELLRAWLESGQPPLRYDVEMIIAYMRELVVNKNIDKLNILLNFLKRRIVELNVKDWIEVYSQVVEQVQNAMIVVYGKKLWIGD